MAQQNDKQKPEAEFRAGLISASVWRNEMQQDGQKVSRYSIRPKNAIAGMTAAMKPASTISRKTCRS